MNDLELMIDEEKGSIKNKTSWKPYEYERAHKQLFDMKVKYMELLTETLSHKPENLQKSELDKWDRADKAIRQIAESNPEQLNAFLEPIEAFKASLKGPTGSEQIRKELFKRFYADLQSLNEEPQPKESPSENL
jgi:hypothetical protein